MEEMEKMGKLKRFIPYFKPYRRILIFDLICAALTTVCELAFPLIIRHITDLGLYNLSALTLSVILRAGGLYLILRIIDALANYYMQNTGHMMGAKIETDMRRDLFDHLQKLPFKYYDNTKIGQIMARVTSDLFDVTEFAHHCPEEFFIAGVKIIVSFIILCGVNVTLTVIIFSVLPFILIGTWVFNRKMKAAFKASRHQIGEINSQVEDSLLGVRVVKSFANEDVEREKFRDGNRKFLGIKGLTYKYMAGFGTMTRLFDGLMYLTVTVVGALFLRAGGIGPADYMAYLLYVSTLLTSIRRIVEFTEQFQRGMTGVERFLEVLDAPCEIYEQVGAAELGEVEGLVEFRDVSFKYSDAGRDVLSHINLRVKPGDHVALVGSSGSGKTTLCNLIPRFYEAGEGEILIDGKPIKSVTLKSLREKIGMVQQDVYLFSGSVFENIAYGAPGAEPERVYEAARLAGADEFIRELEDGYDTYVGERGVKLSGGQKQRISIARAFLKNPPILILDEATSALDNESERIVQKSLERLADGRTTFTIAHRLSTIRNATVILVLNEDGIVEQGTHDELIKMRGVYYNMQNMAGV